MFLFDPSLSKNRIAMGVTIKLMIILVTGGVSVRIKRNFWGAIEKGKKCNKRNEKGNEAKRNNNRLGAINYEQIISSYISRMRCGLLINVQQQRIDRSSRFDSVDLEILALFHHHPASFDSRMHEV